MNDDTLHVLLGMFLGIFAVLCILLLSVSCTDKKITNTQTLRERIIEEVKESIENVVETEEPDTIIIGP